MKKLISLITVLMAFVASCSPSPEKKAEALIKESIKKTLYFPDSYDPIETKIDSAFSPQADPRFISLVLEFNKKGLELEDLQSEIARAEGDVALYNPNLSAYFKTKYNQAKDEYDSLIQKNEQLTSDLQSFGGKISEQLQKTPEFLGYFAYHSYRAKNNNGDTLIGEKYFLIDKDITSIFHTWDPEELELYSGLMEMITSQAEL